MNEPTELKVGGFAHLSGASGAPWDEGDGASGLPAAPAPASTAPGSTAPTQLRIWLGYEGTEYAGWAKQPGLKTVQGQLLQALATIFGHSENDFGMRVAGRTDAGVHALEQQAHFWLEDHHLARLGRGRPMIAIDPRYLAAKLNGLLEPAIRVHAVSPAPAGFDARFSATYRRYRYRIADAIAHQDPLHSRFTLWHPRQLDEVAMQAAALGLLGLHDFAAYCRPKPNASTIRELREISVTRHTAAGEGNLITIELLADAFCHNMVRSIVGGLIAVGDGAKSSHDISRVLASRKRTAEFKVAPAHGLTLLQIGYPGASDMASQALVTRARRDA